MTDPTNGELEEELVDYEEEDVPETDDAPAADGGKKGYVGIHSVGFKDFQIKPELIRAIQDCGFEHPSEIQQECLPLALVGQDILGQAKSGMGKTAVFVLSILHQLEPKDGEVHALIFANTRELAQQIESEFKRFSRYLKTVRVGCYVGGLDMAPMKAELKDENKCPHIVVGTPGRLKQLAEEGVLKLEHVKYFVVDECDKILDEASMRSDVQKVFMKCPQNKQVMMFSATMTDSNRTIAKKFMKHPQEKKMEEAKLTLDGLVQHYVVLNESEKSRKLIDLLDKLDFNQLVIFVKAVNRAKALADLLVKAKFPVACIHSGMKQGERTDVMKKFKQSPNETRILVSTDLVARGVDVERVNVVVNYDMPETSEKKGNGADTYLHRVGRAGRFGTRGLAITFVCSKEETDVLNQVQERFDVDIQPLPDEVDKSTYTNAA